MSPKTSKFLSGPSAAYGLAVAVVIVCGAIPRFDQLGRGLSVAESWVANSVLARSTWGMFYYEHWLQTTPPLFLILVRSACKLLGVSVVTLRAVPLALGVLSLIVLAKLAGTMLRPVFALICTALVAMSPYATAYSKELKQYSSDLFTTCLLLWAIWMYVRCESRRQYNILLLVFSFTLLLSYTAAVFVPLAIVVLLRGERPSAKRCAGLLVLTTVLTAVDYFYFIRPNSSEMLKAFWAAGFPPSSYGADALHFYTEHFASMLLYFYFPAGSGVKDVLRGWVEARPLVIQVTAGITALMGITFATRSLAHRRSERYALLFFLIPLFALLSLNRIGFYPVSSRRLVVFMLPCVALASAAVLQSLCRNLGELLIPHTLPLLRRSAKLCLAALVLLTAVVLASHPGAWDIDTSEDAGMDSAVGYLKARVRQDRDLVYVHAWEEEPARIYLHILHWEQAPIRFGHTGYPCCKRVSEVRPRSAASEREYVLNDFRNVIGHKPDGNLWLILPEPLPEWGPTIHDEPKIIIDSMYASGCVQELKKRFESVDVYEFDCQDSIPLVNSSLHSRFPFPGLNDPRMRIPAFDIVALNGTTAETPAIEPGQFRG